MEQDIAARASTTERAPTGPPPAADAALSPDGQSWGERYGLSTLLFTRNVVINYVINFMIGAVSAYTFETSGFGQRVNEKIKNLAATKAHGCVRKRWNTSSPFPRATSCC